MRNGCRHRWTLRLGMGRTNVSAIVDSFLPLVALIGLGWLCRRRNVIGLNAAHELTLFVVWLALPSLLFDAITEVKLEELWQPEFVLSYVAGLVVPFVFILWWLPKSMSFADRCIDAFSAMFPNAGFMGVSLSLLLFGKEALLPATIAIVMTAVVLFSIGIVLLEFGNGTGLSPMASTRKAALALARNPLVLATVAGLAWSAGGLATPQGVHRILTLLAGAAGPCALVSIGAFLAVPSEAGQAVPITSIVIAKLVLQPAICAVFALFVFDMPRVWSVTAVLTSALPTGTGPVMLAQLYGGNAARASRIMFVTTALSLITISAFIVALR
jgi:malonate transporter